MPTTEVHEYKIEALERQIAELARDCESQHKVGLEAIREVHRRIDDFTKIMVQMSEINKDVQSVVAHQKTLESKHETLVERMQLVERATDSNTDTADGIKRLGWALVLGFSGLIGTTLWQLIIKG